MKASSILITFLISLVGAQKDTGSLDGQDSKDSSQKKSSNSQETASVTKDDQKITSVTISTEKVPVQTSNAVSNTYAVAPSATVVTTDAQGKTTTQYLWWVAETNSAATTISTVSVQPRSEASSIKDSSASYTATSADTPITIVTTTNSLGEAYTSTIWWLPSSAVTGSTASSSKLSSGSSLKSSSNSKEVSTIRSAYVTTSGSKVETLTTTYKSTVNAKVASGISNSTNGAFAGTHIAYGAGIFAVGALLL
ncbi:hypothetical protein SMKI_12G2510 [Saccharomyces mikatae IFO 1815]|uniref:YLR194C-like protein n=1 Tax=Saccharomyces mikatae IFO 1815 TaxID=226126 RepID=A0AA35IQN6_SACMI|nr:uncharacterized protein SMKI_12G2510 [Saccharomyces mikatae IFO 1815]CAI4035111.1 hypothetical protein SMKI_12G2510 [Saccharomyces mikatae IFO 1815]